MIAVCIATYNQKKFIGQAIESVQAQVCDEPIRVYIGDDASTDDTGTICQRYASNDQRIVYVRRTQNVGLVNNTIELYLQIIADGCEYIAMLDGDDYWIDTNKLQLQIDYLRNHVDVGFVHTNGRTLSGAKTWTFGQRNGEYGIDSVGFANCTVVFRTCLLNAKLLEDIKAQNFIWLDYPLYGVFYQQTKWVYLPQKTAIWRDHTSVSRPQTAKGILRLKTERCRMWKWLDHKFPNKVGYTEQKAKDYIYEQLLNLIYQFNDKTLVTKELLNDYKPTKLKQILKLKGLKNNLLYTILQKKSILFAHIVKNV